MVFSNEVNSERTCTQRQTKTRKKFTEAHSKGKYQETVIAIYMFRKNFQGGTAVTIFSPVSKSLLSNWVIPKQARKEYDKNAKTYVYAIQNAAAPQYLSIPKDRKMSLGLTQPFLVLQVHLLDSQAFSLEIRSSCSSGSRKRVLFSTVQSNVKHSVLFSVIPLRLPHRYAWLHLCICVADVIEKLWGEEYKSIESVDVSGTFRMRQIYTLNKNVINDQGEEEWVKGYIEKIPKQCVFPQNVNQEFLLVSKEYLCRVEKTVSEGPSNFSLLRQSAVSRCQDSPRSSSSFAGSERGQMSNRTFTKDSPKASAIDVIDCSEKMTSNVLDSNYTDEAQFLSKKPNEFEAGKDSFVSQMACGDVKFSTESILSSGEKSNEDDQGIPLRKSKMNLWLPTFPSVPLYTVREFLKAKNECLPVNSGHYNEEHQKDVFSMKECMNLLESSGESSYEVNEKT